MPNRTFPPRLRKCKPTIAAVSSALRMPDPPLLLCVVLLLDCQSGDMPCPVDATPIPCAPGTTETLMSGTPLGTGSIPPPARCGTGPPRRMPAAPAATLPAALADSASSALPLGNPELPPNRPPAPVSHPSLPNAPVVPSSPAPAARPPAICDPVEADGYVVEDVPPAAPPSPSAIFASHPVVWNGYACCAMYCSYGTFKPSCACCCSRPPTPSSELAPVSVVFSASLPRFAMP